ncbi:hypothetical protein CLOSTASPAR_02750, partial [[Clostridium] asparagiforme DSM 15981]
APQDGQNLALSFIWAPHFLQYFIILFLRSIKTSFHAPQTDCGRDAVPRLPAPVRPAPVRQ